jgi:SAM-dependent methyltransferase
MTTNPYDELPYNAHPIEWTAPENLALVSLLHGGPRSSLGSYRTLELGCGNGANLLPLAWYRRFASFVGVDGASSQIEAAEAGKSALGLSNVTFVHSNFLAISERIEGHFDFILAHGVFSWIDDDTRDELLRFCVERLALNGLLYLNYNTYPGWRVRGMVREFLLAQTTGAETLRARAAMAQDVSSKLLATPESERHPYAQLLADEFRFVATGDVSYVAHEYLAEHNRAYWRSDFLSLANKYGLAFIGDADFNRPSGRISDDLPSRLVDSGIVGRSLVDTVDLLSYRQLHSPIFSRGPVNLHCLDSEELRDLVIASHLDHCEHGGGPYPRFQHPSGYEVDVRDEEIQIALETVRSVWPDGLRVGDVLVDAWRFEGDLRLLHKMGLIELRCPHPLYCDVPEGPLSAVERQRGDYVTTRYHTREAIAAGLDEMASTELPQSDGTIVSSRVS